VQATVTAFETNIEDGSTVLVTNEWHSDPDVQQIISFNTQATQVKPITIQVPAR
jgi:hypothetical protein